MRIYQERANAISFFENIADEPVDAFINNAGFGTCGKFDETDLGKEVSMINVNIKAMHILFKKMVIKMKKQGYGRILNVASSAGLLPAGPYMATYYATKSYVVSITKAVAEELKSREAIFMLGHFVRDRLIRNLMKMQM